MEGITKEEFHDAIDKLGQLVQVGFDEARKEFQRDMTALKKELETKIWESRMDIRSEMRDTKEGLVANFRALQDAVETHEKRDREDIDELFSITAKLEKKVGVH